MLVDFEHKLTSFQQYTMKLRRERCYGLGQIGNANETPVFIDMLRTSTVNEAGVQEIKIRTTGYKKQRVMFMLCITAASRKLPPNVILKRKNMPKNEVFLGDVIVRPQEKGWMTRELMLDRIKVVWRHHSEASLGGPDGVHSMFVLDAFPAILPRR